MTDGPRVLVVDDNPDDRLLILRELSREFPAAQVVQIGTPGAFSQALEGQRVDLVITDFRLGWIDGIAVLRAVKGRWPDCAVIMFTATGNEEAAVEAMKAGLDDYVLKGPLHYARLRSAARAALALRVEREAVRAAEQALRRSEAQYRLLFNAAGDAILVFRLTPEGLAGPFLRVNDAACLMLGYTRDELLRLSVLDLRPGAAPADLRATMEEIQAREQTLFEWLLTRKDGTTVPAEIASHRFELDGDPAVLSVVRDITERKQSADRLDRQREALYQSEKLATMGQLLAGVAHELNNPLSVVLGQLALLHGKVAEGPVLERMEKVEHAADRCARIVRSFLALARQRAPQRAEVRLDSVVRQAVELLAYPLRVDGVEVALELARDVPAFQGDPDQLNQLVVNLVTNAHHALRGRPGPRRVTVRSRFDAGQRRVTLEVADTGPGIPPELRERIFEPFFTTKPEGQGTGLGLSLCAAIVQEHGGDIALVERPGEGAVFRVELPVEPPPVARAEAAAVEAPAAARARSILVVDDEPEVAGLLADLLAADGHRVDTAANGARALERLGAVSYDLVLTDMRMPELDGPGLYREVERRHPALARRVIFLTGDLLSPEIREFLERTGMPSLSKPFDFADVRRLVRKALDEA